MSIQLQPWHVQFAYDILARSPSAGFLSFISLLYRVIGVALPIFSVACSRCWVICVRNLSAISERSLMALYFSEWVWRWEASQVFPYFDGPDIIYCLCPTTTIKSTLSMPQSFFCLFARPHYTVWDAWIPTHRVKYVMFRELYEYYRTDILSKYLAYWLQAVIYF